MGNMDMVCGNCAFNRYNEDVKGFVCNNQDSENYACETLFDDSCEDYEEGRS